MRKKGNRNQIMKRLEHLEAKSGKIEPLDEKEQQEFEAALKLHSDTGEYPNNEYGDFFRKFDENF